MKYIMFKKTTGSLTIFHPIIFPNHLVHADIADALKGCDGQAEGVMPLHDFTVDSAGEISLFDNDFQCHGSSKTLGVESDPERDTRIIKMNDYGGGMLE